MITTVSVFDFKDYKRYLAEVLQTSGPSRGWRSRLASHLDCQTAFVSQVINGPTHFSLEHAHKVSEFLEHTPEQMHFFMLLVNQERAGHHRLKEYFADQIQEILQKREVISERIQVKQGLSEEARQTYYSTWYYAAIHILLSVPSMQTLPALVNHLRLPPKLVQEALDFLASVGLAQMKGERYKIGTSRIHLGKGSPLLAKHHMNWRLKTMQSLEGGSPEDLHYSSVISLSSKDAKKIKEMALSLLESAEPIINASPEEEVFAFTIDFFTV